MARNLIYQRLRAVNDRNGNPRRLFAVYDLDAAGDLVTLYDEGYSGKPRALPAIELPEVNVTPGEYAAWKREARDSGKLVRA